MIWWQREQAVSPSCSVLTCKQFLQMKWKDMHLAHFVLAPEQINKFTTCQDCSMFSLPLTLPSLLLKLPDNGYQDRVAVSPLCIWLATKATHEGPLFSLGILHYPLAFSGYDERRSYRTDVHFGQFVGNGEKEILFARRYRNVTLTDTSLTQYPLPQYMYKFKNP